MLVIPRLACPSWRWTTTRGDALVRHFHRVSVPELMGREATSHAGFSGRVM